MLRGRALNDPMERLLSGKLEMALQNDIAEVARVLDAVEAFGEEQDLPQKKVFQLNLVLDELITNIVSYGFDGHSGGKIDLSIAFEGDILRAELVDNGKPFNPLEAEIPDIGDDIDEMQVGGLGLKFVRTYVDRLDYRRDGAFNRLSLQMDVKAAG